MKRERNEKAIVPQPPSLRWRALLKDKEGLLRRIQRKAGELTEISQHVTTCQRLIEAGLNDSEQLLDDIRAEIEELLKDILLKKKLSRRQKREINELKYIFAQPVESVLKGEAEEGEAHLASRNIRKRYLKIAHLVHPDRAENEEQRVRFTSLMQELNHAYLKGDLAALMKVEKALGRAPEDDEEPLEDEYEQLEQEIELLQDQYDALSHELSVLRRQPLVELVLSGLSRGEGYAEIAEAALEEIADEVYALRNVKDFIKQYAEGKISTERFLLGPEAYNTGDLIEDNIFLELIDEAETIVEDVMEEERAIRRRLRARRRSLEERTRRQKRRTRR